MSEVTKRLSEQRNRVWTEAQALNNRVADESRSFTADEQSQWTTMMDQIDQLGERADSLRKAEERIKETDAAFATLESNAPERAHRGDNGNEELRGFLSGERSVYESNGKVNLRDLSKLSAGAGADTVPTGFHNRLMTHLVATSGILKAGVTVLSTDSGNPYDVPKTTDHGDATLIGETEAITEDDPAFDKITLGAFKYAKSFQVSNELVNDSAFDIEGYLAEAAGTSIGRALGAHLITGDGSGKPRGIVTDASAGVTGPVGESGLFGQQNTAGEGFDVLLSLYHSVLPQYRMSASCGWLMNDTTVGAVRKLKNSDGVYAWQSSQIDGEPDRINGKPVYVDPFLASPANGAKAILFGDFSRYWVRLVGGVRFERSDHYAFVNDLVTFRALQRADGALIDTTGAVKYYAGGAAS